MAEGRRVPQTFLLKLLPKTWKNYAVLTFAVSLGIYALGVIAASASGTLSAFFSSREWDFEPFYVATHMLVLKLLYHLFSIKEPKIAGVFDASDQELSAAETVFGNSLGALLVSVPFIVYDTLASLSAMAGDGVRVLLVLSWDLEWLFFGSIVWLVGGVLLFFGSLDRFGLRGGQVKVALSNAGSSVGGMSWALGAPLVLFELVNTYYFFATGFWPSDVVAFAVVLGLIGTTFVVPREIVGRKVDQAKDAIERELAAKYSTYVEGVLGGKEPYDQAKAEQYRNMRGLLEMKLRDRLDVVKGTLPILLPVVNLALAYFVEHGLGHIPI